MSKIRPTFHLITPHTVLAFRSYMKVDLDKATFKEAIHRLKVASRWNPLVVYNLNPLWLKSVDQPIYENPVEILLEKPSREVSVVNHKPSLVRSSVTPFFKSKDMFAWYFFYLKKGVFNKKQESFLVKISPCPFDQ